MAKRLIFTSRPLYDTSNTASTSPAGPAGRPERGPTEEEIKAVLKKRIVINYGLTALFLISGGFLGLYVAESAIQDSFEKAKNVLSKWDPEWDEAWRSKKAEKWTGGAKTTARNLLLVRHGQYMNVDKDDDHLQGLTELGKKQADMTGKRLAEVLKDKKVTVIFCSNMKRAKETAQIVSKHFPGVRLVETPLLAEGVPCLPEPPSRSWKPDPKELESDPERMEAAFQQFFHRPEPLANLPNQEGKPPAATDTYELYICHGNVIRYFFCRGLQFPGTAWLRLAVYNCGVTWMTIDNQGYVSARQLGDVGHLPEPMITYH